MNSNNFDKIALITGISGFVGSHLAQQLVAQGWQVRGLIRASSNLRWIQDLPITLYQCGLTNIESLEGPLQGVTHVFHIAGVVKANSLQQFEAGNVAKLLPYCRPLASTIKTYNTLWLQVVWLPPAPQYLICRLSKLWPPNPLIGMAKANGHKNKYA
ncbi:MAG: NAD-dependent epimerase/dehydratase family protein [Sphingobacteriales bacterium]|nr:NAD-dependent epimerase/dehydratase family protein [Sphingobacteriales bacterium]